ncbi:hypothetical protein Hdeb2414_s0010g00348951 [Helianthus debilis subsp. tardiflorus]
MSIVGCHHNYYLIVGLLFVISGCGHAGKPKRQLSYLNHHHSRGFGDQKERDLGLHVSNTYATIFFSTRSAILWNLHVEMFGVKSCG